ncbi:type 1 glutamine amidotransferase [Streptomyces sp. NPDC091292]|uniref:type 1 glutamine amidotransferase n=1 Tax=Streptomyces sp. NPDC091292 TaxID=3365991 RepID=UPI00382478A2
MESAATALVVQNSARGGPRRWADWLAEGGVGLDVVRGDMGDALPKRLTHDALIVLGGGYLPDDDNRAPWLAAARDLMSQALEQNVPVFGICLGGQMLAHVAGGKVEAEHGRPEFGSTALALLPEAAEDPLFTGLPERPTAIENHVDAIVRLPEGAQWLASSEHCPYQAFRVGQEAWGVQFHPETGPDRIPQWPAGRLERYEVDPKELHRLALRDDPAAARVWREVALRFAVRVQNHRRRG